MTENQVIEDNTCEHCGRKFIRPTTLLKHLCEQKRRWLDKDRPANRIAYGSWKNYYEIHYPSKKKLSYTDFINNNYYGAFTRFGIYCTDVNVINSAAFSTWLVKQRIPIDNWASDRSYTKYLVEYLRVEDCMEAVKRSVQHLLDLAQDENILLNDIFRFGNSNKLCYMITTGMISPWVLYLSVTGKEFLSKLNQSQQSLVLDYIDPEKWNIKLKRESEKVAEVQSVLRGIPL